jgi:hypothetical protein
MNDEHRKNVALKILANITPDNLEEIYLHYYDNFLFENSDEVEINYKIYTNSRQDRLKRFLLSQPDENGFTEMFNSKSSNIKNGIKINELDFINYQISIFEDFIFEDFEQKKVFESYLNFVFEKKKLIENKKIVGQFSYKEGRTINIDLMLNKYKEYIESLKSELNTSQLIINICKDYKENRIDDVVYYALQELKNIIEKPLNKNESNQYLKQIKQLQFDLKSSIKDELNKPYSKFELYILSPLQNFIFEIEILLKASQEKPNVIITENLIEPQFEHPFSITGNFELFKYLDKCFKPENIAKYTYIFDFIKDKEKLETTLNEKMYFEYIAKLKPHLGLKTFRPQPTATNEKKQELVKKLYQIYLDETKK